MRFLFIFILLSSHFALAAKRPGVFQTTACLKALPEIYEARGDAYRAEAHKLGYNEIQTKEYLARRARSRFLLEEKAQALNEYEFAMLLLGNFVKSAKEFGGNAKETKELLRIFAKKIGEVEEGGQVLEEMLPLVFQMIEERPPARKSQYQDIVDLHALRTAMRMARFNTSRNLANLPIDKNGTEVTKLETREVGLAKGHGFTQTLAEVHKLANRRVNDVEKRYRQILFSTKDNLDFPTQQSIKSLSQKLLNSTLVPENIKEEITQEENYYQKLNMPLNLMYHEFLLLTADYFGIEH